MSLKLNDLVDDQLRQEELANCSVTDAASFSPNSSGQQLQAHASIAETVSIGTISARYH
jgi:hypothetical protein